MSNDILSAKPILTLAPYSMWKEIGAQGQLTHEAVVTGFARWLTIVYIRMWYLQTTRKLRWYLKQREGLFGWSRIEAQNRLALHFRPTWTACDFHEFHFREDVLERKNTAFRDPFWSPLILHKHLTGDLRFFTHQLPFLLSHDSYQGQAAKRLFAIMYDRLSIPLAWWRYSAAAAYLEYSLSRLNLHTLAPSGELLRQWSHELGLKARRPAIITEWNRGIGVPKGGFNLEAFLQAGIPHPTPRMLLKSDAGIRGSRSREFCETDSSQCFTKFRGPP